MRKIPTLRKLSLLFMSAFLFNNSLKAEENSKSYSRLFVSLEGNYWTNLALNKNLDQTRMTGLQTLTPNIGLGYVVKVGSWMTYSQISAFFNNGNDKELNVKNRFYGVDFSFGVMYELFEFNHQALYAGLKLSSINSNAKFYSSPASTDFNASLNPNNTFGVIELYNNQFFVSPTITTGNLFSKALFPIQIFASYDLNLSRSKWKSEVYTFDVAPRESSNRVSLGLRLLLQ